VKKRVETLTRLGRLQGRMHDLGRWRLSAIERERASLGDDLKAALKTLEIGDLAYGAQASFGAGYIRALQRRLDSLARDEDHVRRKAEALGLRAKLAERAAATAAEVYREQKERKELAELIEHTVARRRASST
jgi:hypothetical protein